MQVLEVETFWKLSTIAISELRWELWGYRKASHTKFEFGEKEMNT